MPEQDVKDPARLVSLLARRSVTRLVLVPSLLAALLEAYPDLGKQLPKLRVWTASGEVLSASIARQLLLARPECILLNLYGSSEVAGDATWFQVTKEAANLPSVPIGRPLANTQVYLLDPHLQPVPIGVPGEIYVGGDGLARGYHGQPARTAERFISDAFSGKSGAKLYRTGDLGRYLPDGNIEFLGRADSQVKLRGYRIELGEIEAVLEQHEGVSRAILVARDDLPGGRGLVAYLATNRESHPTSQALRSYLRERLPEYMMPAAFVFLDSFPATPSGKVDRNALPRPSLEARTAQEANPVPRDRLERDLLQIWEEVLGVHPIGLGDDFFELGGHSLLGVRLFARIEKTLGRKLPVALLFRAPTVEQLARAIRGAEAPVEWNPLVLIQPQGDKPPFFCVHGFGGGVLGYAELARLLGKDRPFYGLQARGRGDGQAPHTEIETMAADYIGAIQTVQPHGPYFLGGYCYGGVVAFEMARQLYRQGEAVGLLAILEGYASRRQEALQELRRFKNLVRLAQNLPWWLKDNLSQRAELLVRRLSQSETEVEREIREWDELNPRSEFSRVPADTRRVMEAHRDSLSTYRPQAFPGVVTLFRCRTLSLLRSYDPEMGWGRFARKIVIQEIPGAHYNILKKPHVAGLAAHLRAHLTEAQARFPADGTEASGRR